MNSRVPMSDNTKVAVENKELFTVRDAMRSLNRIVDRINGGELEKAVLTRGGKMVALIVPIGYKRPIR